VLVALASAKGSPGVTTTARVMASVWPGGAVLADADPAGGDVAFVARSAQGGGPLDPDRGLLSLAVEARRGVEGVSLDPHLQVTDGGLPVLAGIARPDQVAGMGPVWPAVGSVLAAHPGDVVVDVGRLSVGSPVLPVVAAADALVLLVRPRVEAYAHLRERLAWLASLGTAGAFPSVGVAVLTDARDSRSSRELADLLAHSGLAVPVIGTVAEDPRAADVIGGRKDRPVARSLLVRSVRQLTTVVRSVRVDARDRGALR